MALEFLLLSVIRNILLAVLLFCFAACDRGSGSAEQQFAAPDAADQEENVADDMVETIESDSGLVGNLDISQRGTPMLDVQFTAPDGSVSRLSDFKGRPLLVNIWATWCAPCIVEMPMLDELAVREQGRLKVLTVSQDIDGPTKVTPFWERQNFAALEPYLDPENGLSFGFDTGLMPTTVLYDAQGREVWRVIGAMDWNGPRAAALMEETLAE